MSNTDAVHADLSSDSSCVVRRVLAAPAATVFRAWTDPRFATQWSWGSKHDTVSLEIDLRAGGVWKHHTRNRDTGEQWFFDGVFSEVIPDCRIAHSFEWRSDRGVHHPASHVTIDFVALGEHTEVVITHERIATVTERDGTVIGWNDCVDCVARLLPTLPT